MSKVTVLTTLYNKGPWVTEAVRSVLAQTFTNFELLIVDDASTDDGLRQVQAFTDPRIRILESPVNTGRAAAANRGFAAARGEFIAVLDADDLMHSERLSKQVAYLDAHPGVGVVGSWTQAFGESERSIHPPSDDRAARALELFGIPVLYNSCMMRRSVLAQFNIRCNPQWLLPGMDRLLILAIGRHAAYANLPEVLTSYRTGAQNMRHGRDPVKDRVLLDMEVLRSMGFPHGRRQAELHLYLHADNDLVPRTAWETWLLHRWVKTLVQRNREHPTMDPSAFEQEIGARWHRLFHDIVEHSAAGSLIHMLASGTFREQYRHWAKITKDRWLRR